MRQKIIIAGVFLVIGWIGGLTFQSSFPNQQALQGLQDQLTSTQQQNSDLQNQVSSISAELTTLKAHPLVKTVYTQEGPHPCLAMPQPLDHVYIGPPIPAICN